MFVLPLLVVYELGVVAVGGPQSLSVRNGADAWLRWLLATAGFGLGILTPALIVVGLFAWALRCKREPPNDPVAVALGMVLESVGLAVALWALSRAFGPMLDSLGVTLATPSQPTAASASPLAQAITFLGAGIYEEVIFRLGLFSAVAALLRAALVPGFVAGTIAIAVSALGFAAVHHLGAHGEAVNGYVFVFRALAGLIFTVIFVLRGFGIAVGAHACYDVLVGIAL